MVIGTILIFLALVHLVIGLRFIFGYERSQALVWYGLFVMSIALYVASNGFGYLINNFYIAERIGWIGGLMTATFILPFSQSFPLARHTLRELMPLVIWPIFVFIPGLLFTDIFLIDHGVINYRAGYQTQSGPYFGFALAFFGVYWVWGLYNLIRSMQRSDGRHRWLLKMILLGLIISLFVSVIFDIVLPLVSKSTLGYVGSMFSTVWLGFTSYILLKK